MCGALEAARELWYPAFPCAANKRPTVKDWPNVATLEPARLQELWAEHPGPLVGVPMGPASGLMALDLDTARHPEAIDWLDENHHRIPLTQQHMTQSSGTHFLFRWKEGLRNTTSRICKGIDTRGDGGFVIWWPSANFPIYNDGRIAECPDFILEALREKSRPLSPMARRPIRHQPQAIADAAIKGILRKVAGAPHGIKSNTLFWGSCRLGERVKAKQIPDELAFDLLAEAADDAGWPEREALKHIERGLRIGAGGA
jgi:hypothetical protein